MRVANGGAGLQPGPHLWPNLRALERLAFISPDPPHRVHGDHQAHRRHSGSRLPRASPA